MQFIAVQLEQHRLERAEIEARQAKAKQHLIDLELSLIRRREKERGTP